MNQGQRAAEILALEAEINYCTRYPLYQTRTKAVQGEGDINIVAMFVGEGPGSDENRQGRPFVGRSSEFLTEVLSNVGIQREDVFITNIVKCRPQ